MERRYVVVWTASGETADYRFSTYEEALMYARALAWRSDQFVILEREFEFADTGLWR